ncbi:unnamed protein product [Peniophora sp. CBMAI 1063]|nr:unnamed protein product [Peniophora sp. CBMAI 1063]
MISTTHLLSSLAIALVAVAGVHGETHTISFVNNCGFGTPTLVSQNGAILSTGGSYTANGQIVGAIAYLQTGACGLNGDNCLTVETTLINGASSTDLTLIPDHAFSALDTTAAATALARTVITRAATLRSMFPPIPRFKSDAQLVTRTLRSPSVTEVTLAAIVGPPTMLRAPFREPINWNSLVTTIPPGRAAVRVVFALRPGLLMPIDAIVFEETQQGRPVLNTVREPTATAFFPLETQQPTSTMFFPSLITSAIVSLAAVAGVYAESHTITFVNKCGRGTPTLRAQNGAVLSTGGAYTINGPLIGAIAYLQTGGCGANGENCLLVETTLRNPPSPGAGSSTDLSLIPPHAFSVTTGFGYYNGCNGAGADCTGPSCTTAFHKPTDTYVQVQCETNNVDLSITFCD